MSKKITITEEEIIKKFQEITQFVESGFIINVFENKKHLFDIELPKSKEKISDKKLILNLEEFQNTDEFIELKTKELIEKLLTNLFEWQEVIGTTSVFLYATNVKKELNYYEEVLSQKAENRIFVSLLDLIFMNDNSIDLSLSQIKNIQSELKRFEKGEVTKP